MWILFSLILYLPIPSIAQPLAFDLLNHKKEIEVPFKQSNGFILLEVRLANTFPLTFLFDTGAENTILFHKEYSDILNIKYDKKIKIHGADLSTDLYAHVARNMDISIENTIYGTRDILVLDKQSLELPNVMGINIDGIIGGSFFRGLVISIDYDKEKIKFIDPLKFKPPSDFSELDLEINGNKPYLMSKTYTAPDRITESKLLLDTGSAIPLLLHTNADTSFVLPPNLMIGSLGTGLGGLILGFKGKLHKVEFGRFAFENVITAFQEIDSTFLANGMLIRDGLLGNELLSRFEVIIDYFRSKLYLKPNKDYTKAFKYDRSGIILFALGRKFNQFVINAIIDGSPAHKADLRQGDKILKMGCWKSKFWSLGRINSTFSSQKRKKIRLQIERNGEKLKKVFYLDDYFNIDRSDVIEKP